MMRTEVVHKRNAGPDAIYIGRPSRWGNPFVVGQDGTRQQVIEKYREHLWVLIKNGDITLDDLMSLRGKQLACWCKPQACHGDVLAKAIDWAIKERTK